jgi:UDPglucose 6-dehydrogenase
MKIGVAGLWHLGSVVSACLAKTGFTVVGVDDAAVVDRLALGHPPMFEPGLDDLVVGGLKDGNLTYSAEQAQSLCDVDILWITYDTPVDDDDKADVRFVEDRVAILLPMVPNGAIVLISSQLPVGSTRRLKDTFATDWPNRQLHFAYSPENLRLGKAIASFLEADRIVVGVDSIETRTRLEPMCAKLGYPAIWMGIEAAEMVKHTINAFLAISVTFINEIAALCESVGADASEVETGIRSEPRIGTRAYVKPGGAFAGGTLARDVGFLTHLAHHKGLSVPVLESVLPSNRLHNLWTFRKIVEVLGKGDIAALQGLRASILGLTYKPGTNTLRRSSAIELCLCLIRAGAHVKAFDPAVAELPDGLAPLINLQPSVMEAATDADVLVVATECPEFAELDPATVAVVMRHPVVIDQNGFIAPAFARSGIVSYFRVGKPS